MKTKHVIGQRIVHVDQGITSRGHGFPASNSIGHIELENGTKLIPQVQECEGDYQVDMVVNRVHARRVKRATMNPKMAAVINWAREACKTERARLDAYDADLLVPSWLPELEAAIKEVVTP